MRVDIITLFPELFPAFLQAGVTRRAYDSGQLDVKTWNPRDYAEGNYKRVDDRPFGGGPGMVMLAEPLSACLAAVRADSGLNRQRAPLVYFSPVGEVLNQSLVERSGQTDGVVLLCGRYEGIDQRFIDAYVDTQISLGDFVLSGGEIAAMAWLDALARLQPGVLHDEQSHLQDSFTPALSGLLDCPHYTRPEVWQDQTVPEALLSGHHAQIAAWRRQQSLTLTGQTRPDLLEKARQSGLLTRADEQLLANKPKA
jgi:tRNA (guanine37-N1)-methyltransferase